VKGLGAALQSKILQGIDIRRKGEGQRHLHHAAKLLDGAEERLRRSKLDIKQIVPAGDFRRGCEIAMSTTVRASGGFGKLVLAPSAFLNAKTPPALIQAAKSLRCRAARPTNRVM
jgi:hypothetical protein